MSRFLINLFFMFFFVSPAIAEFNISINKPYALSPPPSYPLCTDAGDSTDLTDGKFCKSHWSNKRTVGWLYPEEIPQITIDLEKVYYIEHVDIHTVAGARGGVEFPAYAVVLVSNNSIDYRAAGFARIPAEVRFLGQNGPSEPYVLRVPHIAASGRFIKIIIQMATKMFFCDEIKIIGRDDPPDVVTALPVSIKNDFAYNTIQAVEERLEMIQGISETQRYIFEKKDSFPRSQLDSWSADLHEMMNLCSELRLPLISQQQLEQAQKDLGLLRAAIYREVYREPWALIHADPMRSLSRSDMLVDSRNFRNRPAWLSAIYALTGVVFPRRPDVTVSMWQREYESLAFNIINCSPETLEMNAKISVSAKQARKLPVEQVFTLRRAEYVYGIKAGYIADPLLLLDEQPFEIKPGQVVQVWVTVDSEGLTSAHYSASLEFSGSSKTRPLPKKKISVRVQVAPLVMPRQMTLNSYAWAYPAQLEITRNNQTEAARDLQAHYTNVFILDPKSLPFPRDVQAWGRPIPRESYAAMDAQLNSNSYARMYLFFMGFSITKQDRGRFGEWMSEPWKSNFKSWLVQMVEHLQQRGLGYDRFALYPYDEYIGDDFYKVARLIKETDPRIKIFVNSYGKGPQDFVRVRNFVDIWCVHQDVSDSQPDWLKTVISFGTETWTYKATGPVRAQNPFEHYRRMSWWTFKHGLIGAGFWVYADPGSVPWHEYATPMGYYGVVYGSANAPVNTRGEKIVPSRRWEVWREGVEDYQYLVTLHNLINRTQKSYPEKAAAARRMLEYHVDAVLSGTAVEIRNAREQMTSKILELDAVAY